MLCLESKTGRNPARGGEGGAAVWSVLGDRQAGLSGVSSLVIGDKASKTLVNGGEAGEYMRSKEQ